MSKRITRTQSVHDTEVRKQAERLKRNGWRVEADIPGYARPIGIGQCQRRPDVVASRGSRRRVIEVETPTSLRRDREQQATFRRHASHKANTTFQVVVTD